MVSPFFPLKPRGVGYNNFLIAFVDRNRDPAPPQDASTDFRDPQIDKLYPICTHWRNNTDNSIWLLLDIANNLGNWVKIATGGTGPILQVQVQAATAPGVNPVDPTNAGLLILNANIVAQAGIPFRTHTSALSTIDIELQTSTTSVASDATKNGVSHFSDADFNVDANGFVTSNGRTVRWVTISASQTLEVNTGYFCISPGGALSLALPATATIGDIIEVTLDGSTSWTITQAAGQQIRFGNLQTTAGVGGSLSSTAQGDTIRMVAQTATKWNVISSVGNLTII